MSYKEASEKMAQVVETYTWAINEMDDILARENLTEEAHEELERIRASAIQTREIAMEGRAWTAMGELMEES